MVNCSSASDKNVVFVEHFVVFYLDKGWFCTLWRESTESFIMVRGAHVWYPACSGLINVRPDGSESMGIAVEWAAGSKVDFR